MNPRLNSNSIPVFLLSSLLQLCSTSARILSRLDQDPDTVVHEWLHNRQSSRNDNDRDGRSAHIHSEQDAIKLYRKLSIKIVTIKYYRKWYSPVLDLRSV